MYPFKSYIDYPIKYLFILVRREELALMPVFENTCLKGKTVCLFVYYFVTFQHDNIQINKNK